MKLLFILICSLLMSCVSTRKYNRLKHQMEDYQLQLHMDTVWIYDKGRLVGSYISNWRNQMDTIIINDNL